MAIKTKNLRLDIGIRTNQGGLRKSEMINQIVREAFNVGTLESRSMSAEPTDPDRGDMYLLPAGALTGPNWSVDDGAKENALAIFTNIAGTDPWRYLDMQPGWDFYDEAAFERVVHDGNTVVVETTGTGPSASVAAEKAERVAADALKADAAALTQEISDRQAADLQKADQSSLDDEVIARINADLSKADQSALNDEIAARINADLQKADQSALTTEVLSRQNADNDRVLKTDIATTADIAAGTLGRWVDSAELKTKTDLIDAQIEGVKQGAWLSDVNDIAARDAVGAYRINDKILVLDDGDGKWAAYFARATAPAPANWFKFIDEDNLNTPLSFFTQAQAVSTNGANYTQQSLISTEALDFWGISRRQRRVFNVSAPFDFNALGYADKTAVFVRNIDNANGINITYGENGTQTLEITRASGITQTIPNENTFNVQPAEFVVIEKEGTTVRVSILPGERVKNFTDYGAANSFGSLPHDGIVLIKDTQQIWARKTTTNGILFPADGVENDDWGIWGGSQSTTPIVSFIALLRLQDVTGLTFGSRISTMFPPNDYMFIPNNSQDDDGLDIIKPNSIDSADPGRFVRLGSDVLPVDAAQFWSPDTEYEGTNNVPFILKMPATVVEGPFVTLDGVELEAGKEYILRYDATRLATASISAISDNAETVAEVNLMNFIGSAAVPNNDDWIPVADGGNFGVGEVSYQELSTDTGIEPTLTAGQWFSFVRPDADGKNIATYKFHNGTEVKTIETGTNELAVVRYTADGAIQDFDHKAIFETGAVNMTLSASTVGRVIQMVSEGPTTVVTADGTEQFTGSQGTSADSKLTINQAFKWATIIGRTAGGWSQYVGQAGIPDGVDISTPTTFKAATRLVQNGVENSASITFPTPFKTDTIPSVLPVPFAPGDNQSVTLQSVDHLGFTVWVVRNESDVGIASPTIHWSATGEPA